MAKDPAFLFYPNDWLGGTMGMTFEEKGAYMDLLMMQFNRGHMTSHMIGQTVGQLWDSIEDKFIKDDKGLWYNERLQLEQIKRKSFTSSRKNNLKGNNQYTKKNGHTTSRMEDVNEDINKDVYLNKKEKFNFRKSLIELNISDDIIESWLLVRKNKKATNSKIALNKIVSEIDKTKLTYNEVIKICVEKSWSGFNKSWLDEKSSVKKEKTKSRLDEFIGN